MLNGASSGRDRLLKGVEKLNPFQTELIFAQKRSMDGQMFSSGREWVGRSKNLLKNAVRQDMFKK
jgi:hypothetical protein